MSIFSALGFTLFGAFAGVLLTLRLWYGQMKTPGSVRSLVIGLRQSLLAMDHEGKLAAELFRDRNGPPTCPLCGACAAHPFVADVGPPLTEVEIQDMLKKNGTKP